MEYDRYQQNHTLFIVAMSCLVLSMALFSFSVYIAPALAWGFHYDIPLFVQNWQEFLHINYAYTLQVSAWLVILVFLVPACVTGYIAYFASNRIENAIYHIHPEVIDETTREINSEKLQESTGLGLKIFFLIMVVIILTFVFQWFFSVTA